MRRSCRHQLLLGCLLLDVGSGFARAAAEWQFEKLVDLFTVAPDGGGVTFGRGQPHPRNYGTFPRVLGMYVREQGVLTLEDAVRKMTSYPAQRFGLMDRGVLRPGLKADVVVFDPATVRDDATYEQPHQYGEGFSFVIVNGQIVLDGDRVTTARPGVVLRGAGYR